MGCFTAACRYGEHGATSEKRKRLNTACSVHKHSLTPSMLQTSDLLRGIRPRILNCLGHQEPPNEALERTSAIYTKWVAQVWPQTQCVRAIGPANLIQQSRRPRAETGHRTAGLHKDWSLNLGPNSPCINVQPTQMELKNFLCNIGSECITGGKWYVDNCPIHAHLAGRSAVRPTPENQV